jgi:hypothetical protein
MVKELFRRDNHIPLAIPPGVAEDFAVRRNYATEFAWKHVSAPADATENVTEHSPGVESCRALLGAPVKFQNFMPGAGAPTDSILCVGLDHVAEQRGLHKARTEGGDIVYTNACANCTDGVIADGSRCPKCRPAAVKTDVIIGEICIRCGNDLDEGAGAEWLCKNCRSDHSETPPFVEPDALQAAEETLARLEPRADAETAPESPRGGESGINTGDGEPSKALNSLPPLVMYDPPTLNQLIEAAARALPSFTKARLYTFAAAIYPTVKKSSLDTAISWHVRPEGILTAEPTGPRSATIFHSKIFGMPVDGRKAAEVSPVAIAPKPSANGHTTAKDRPFPDENRAPSIFDTPPWSSPDIRRAATACYDNPQATRHGAFYIVQLGPKTFAGKFTGLREDDDVRASFVLEGGKWWAREGDNRIGESVLHGVPSWYFEPVKAPVAARRNDDADF